jgi:hypothetical protein
LAIAACVAAGAAFACEDEAGSDDSIAFAKPNASQKPVVIAVDSRGSAVAGRPSVSTKKTANKRDTAVATPKTAMKRAATECAGSDC